MEKSTLDYIKVEIKKEIFLLIYPSGKQSKIFKINEEEAKAHGECPVQLLEAKRYEYILEPNVYRLKARGKVITPSRSESHRGILFTGNNVGSLQLDIVGKEQFSYAIEVLATKFDSKDDYDNSYRTNYRSMLLDITEKCTELIMQSNSLVNQYFEPDFSNDNETLYQKFSFIKSILQSEDFEESLLKIFSSPKTSWISEQEEIDVRRIKRLTNRNLRNLTSGQSQIQLPSSHTLYKSYQLESISIKIPSSKQKPSLDNPENRFIKHTLKEYLQFCENCKNAFKVDSKDHNEVSHLVSKLENYLNHPFFNDVSKPTTIKLNSPTLQRKSGYRQILKTWLMFDLAAKLTWSGGQDVYNAGKRDIATLYEYWLFFVLYDLFKEKFGLDNIQHNNKPYNHLFEKTKNGINLIIKSGLHTALEGTTVIKHRKLKVKFSFNRTFTGKKDSFPAAGSWTMNMRPDYTLSVWPQELKENEAEVKEEIVHIHFDAKYKVNHFNIGAIDKRTNDELTEKEIEDLNKKEQEERIGKFKNGDLYKMHTYRDAIRRTGGAYILYPGTKHAKYRGFHELIPGLGAFSINPASEKTDVLQLSNFIDKVIDHLVNRASQRENIAAKTYEITKGGKQEPLAEPLPEYLAGEKLIPDDTHVIVGFSKNSNCLKWYKDHGRYNFRMNDNKGSLIFSPQVVKAKFLLLRESGKSQASILYKLKGGIKVLSKERLKELDHPQVNKEHYLVLDIDTESKELEVFRGMKWNFKELEEYKKSVEGKNIRSAAGLPFVVTLTELMRCKDTN